MSRVAAPAILVLLALAALASAAPVLFHQSEFGSIQLTEEVGTFPNAPCDGPLVLVSAAEARSVPRYISVQCNAATSVNTAPHHVNQLTLRFVSGVQAHSSGLVALVTRKARLEEVTSSLHMNQAAFCVGFNADGSCQNAQAPIPIYSSQLLQASCSDCFVGFSGEFVLHLDVFRREFEIGFTNLTLDWAAVVTATAQKSWTVGFNKDYEVAKIEILNSKIGFIPIHVWVEIPLNLEASVTLSGQAEASIGLKANGNLGSLLSIYKDGKWTHESPSADFSYQVVKTFSYDGTADASASIVPQLQLHVDDIFDGNLVFTPLLTAHAEIHTGLKGCVSAQESMKLDWTGEVKLSFIRVDKTWDKNLWSQQHTIVNTC
eukprot:ANDGO_06615.mRNA.1 hypothetical protein